MLRFLHTSWMFRAAYLTERTFSEHQMESINGERGERRGARRTVYGDMCSRVMICASLMASTRTILSCIRTNMYQIQTDTDEYRYIPTMLWLPGTSVATRWRSLWSRALGPIDGAWQVLLRWRLQAPQWNTKHKPFAHRACPPRGLLRFQKSV